MMFVCDTIPTMYSTGIHHGGGFIGMGQQQQLQQPATLPVRILPPRQVTSQLKRSLSTLMLPTADFMLYGASNYVLEGLPSRRPRLEKRVHFSNIVFDVTLPPLEEEDKSLLWWECSNFDERRASDQSIIVQNSAENNGAYHDSLVYLMKSYKKGQDREELRSHVQIILQADARGLEHRIAPKIRAHRYVHMKEVLRLQKKARQGRSL